MRLLVFLIISYVLLPFTVLYIYRWELLQFYPPFIVTDTAIASFPGVYLFFLFMTQIVLGSRPKFLEKGIGLNVVMRVHGNTTFATLVFMGIHYQIHKLTVSFASYTGRAIALIFLFVVLVTLCFWVNSPLSNLPIIRSIRKWLHTILQYQHFRAIHNLMAVAAILVVVHVNSTSFAQDSVYAISIVYLYFIFSISIYVYHKFIKPFVIARRVWEVSKVIVETKEDLISPPKYPKVVTIQLTQLRGTPLRYSAGQFGFIKFISGALVRWGEEHPFSFSSSPDDAHISLTIQDTGDFTHRLVNECQKGDKLVMDAPYGVFCVPTSPRRKKERTVAADRTPAHVVGIAGGIGVTPYIAWLEYLKMRPSVPIRFSLLWMRSEYEDMLSHRVCAYNSCPHIDVETFFTYKKPLNAEKIKEFVEKCTHFYICASPRQIDVVTKLLRRLGVRKRHIHSEKFSMF